MKKLIITSIIILAATCFAWTPPADKLPTVNNAIASPGMLMIGTGTSDSEEGQVCSSTPLESPIYTGASDNVWWIRTGYNTTQGYSAGTIITLSGQTICRFDIQVGKEGSASPGTTFTGRVYTVSGDDLSELQGESDNSYTLASVSDGDWLQFNFASGVSTASADYALVIYPNAVDTSNCLYPFATDGGTSGRTNGEGLSWTDEGLEDVNSEEDDDVNFKVYTWE